MEGLMKAGIIIECVRRIPGHNRGYVPSTLTNDERYSLYTEKLAARGLSPKINGYPWLFRTKKKPKTFLDQKPKKSRRKKIMETVAV